MRKIFYILTSVTVGTLVLGMLSFDNFRDRLYLAAMLLGFLTIFAGVEYIARHLDTKE